MTRMKKGEEGHAEAVAKWRKTMYEKYGGTEGVHAKMQAIGHKGGKAGDPTKKGFASNIERAKKAGAKGGKISKRGPAKKHKAEADGNAGTTRIFEVV